MPRGPGSPKRAPGEAGCGAGGHGEPRFGEVRGAARFVSGVLTVGFACCVISISFPSVTIRKLLGAAGQITNFPLQFLIFNSFSWGVKKKKPKPRLALPFGAAPWLLWRRSSAFPVSSQGGTSGRRAGTLVAGRAVSRWDLGLCRREGPGGFVPRRSYRVVLVGSHQSASSTACARGEHPEVKMLGAPTAACTRRSPADSYSWTCFKGFP